MLDVNSIIVVLRRLGFICSHLDILELRTFLLNHSCFTTGPHFQEKHVIFVDANAFFLLLTRFKEMLFGEAQYQPSSLTPQARASTLLKEFPNRKSKVDFFKAFIG